jgi:hypothetical protein
MLTCYKPFLLNQLFENHMDDPRTRSDAHLTSAKMEVESNHGSSVVPNSTKDNNNSLKWLQPSSISAVSLVG